MNYRHTALHLTFLINNNCIHLVGTTYFDIHIHCEMNDHHNQVNYISITSHNYPLLFFVVRTLRSTLLANFNYTIKKMKQIQELKNMMTEIKNATSLFLSRMSCFFFTGALSFNSMLLRDK